MSIKPGQHLGQYVIVEQIGKGGMATVFRASQPSLSRQVAIKILPEFFKEDPTFHDRFRQEAMAIAKLRHPNVLTVFDSGEADGIAYIVTELVDGGTLVIVYAGGREIARATTPPTSGGGIGLMVLPRVRGQVPAVLRLDSLEIYEAGR